MAGRGLSAHFGAGVGIDKGKMYSTIIDLEAILACNNNCHTLYKDVIGERDGYGRIAGDSDWIVLARRGSQSLRTAPYPQLPRH